MRLTGRIRHLTIAGHDVRLRRTTGGVAEIWAGDEIAFSAALGFVHALDRLSQMMVVRLVGQGRVTECLVDNDEAFALDLSMRTMGFVRNVKLETQSLSPPAQRMVDAYSLGVNEGLTSAGFPLDLRFARYRPEPWRPEDVILTTRLLSYVGLAQTQQDLEKTIIEALRQEVSLEALKDLFAPHLQGIDPELCRLLKSVRYHHPLVSLDKALLNQFPSFSASNNWAIAGHASASGLPIACHDPHLEINRIPPFWYEIVAHLPNDDRIGISLPGIPGLLMGRTRHLSFGFTYGFMDMVDFFVEQVEDRCVRRKGEAEPVRTRQEWMRRKAHRPTTVSLHETSHGILETDPLAQNLEDGYYLCRAYSHLHDGAAPSLNAISQLPGANTVTEAQEILREATLSANWVLADTTGDIAYQQTGKLPQREHSGLHPVPGWDPTFAWEGFVPSVELTAYANPPEGFVLSANNYLDAPDKAKAVNACMGEWRANRIRSLLTDDGGTSRTIEAMKRWQTDTTSSQAQAFLKKLRPWFPHTNTAAFLAEWDCGYDVESRGATLFEELYLALLEEVFGKRLMGSAYWKSLREKTLVVHVYHHLFDRILLGEDNPNFFAPKGQESLYRTVLERILDNRTISMLPTWGTQQQVTLNSLLLGRRLPHWLGFDRGPFALAGGRATIVQSGKFTAHSRETVIHPCYRFITDLGTDEAHTLLVGGPSGQRFSGHYANDLALWLKGEYKTLDLGGSPSSKPF